LEWLKSKSVDEAGTPIDAQILKLSGDWIELKQPQTDQLVHLFLANLRLTNGVFVKNIPFVLHEQSPELGGSCRVQKLGDL